MDWYLFYNVLSIIFMVMMVLLSIAMIIIVILQEGNETNLGAITGAAESFFGKNKAKTLDSKFKRWTMIISGSILVCSILFFVVYLLRARLG
ncbi:MAG: preprotein translocase subunit SecG [Clostridiales bacterium]|jgi:preprotein translocase subunit SecG|nr:preprotein translocase subunit SecG [Clostridiales bacterium]HOB63753.1 preprotein translocase subunit SecG [Clostridia bacterium]HOK82138.1 preprotein translocase subunit SecG [Clostridia bacterium]HOL61078.1 preprotein translocase subunit SecG [Clostridia bacterium]HPO53990.1 preprotein translocase subunit SecG [Clostridia bacterium]